MSKHLQSDKRKTMHEYSHRIIDLEISKNMELLEAIENNNKFKWFVFLSSLFFIVFISIALILARGEDQNLFINVIVVDFGFNLIFTYGFSQALVYNIGYPYLLNMNLNDEQHHRNIKLFIWSGLVGIILSVIISQILYYLWIKGEYVSSILDSTLLVFIFMHMIKGINAKTTSRQLTKIRNKYSKETNSIISEFDNWLDANDIENVEEKEVSINLKK